VAGSPQIGQQSKTRRRTGSISVTSADSPGSLGWSATSSVGPSLGQSTSTLAHVKPQGQATRWLT
jgi:hypothetical protein